MIRVALARGLAALFRPRLLLAFWLVNVVLALFVALPYQRAAFEATGHVPDPPTLAAEAGPPYWDDFKRAQQPALSAIGSVAGVAGWAWLVLVSVLTGGVVGAFDRRTERQRRAQGERWSYRVFFADAGRYAGRMLRLLVVGLLLAFLLDWVFNDWLATLHEHHLTVVESEKLSVLTDWLRQGVFLLLLFGLATWTDLARVAVVIERRQSVLGALVSALGALLDRPLALFGVAATWVVTEGLVMVGAAVLLAGMRTEDLRSLGTWVLLVQLLVLIRLGLGFARLASYASITEELRDEREAGAPAA